MEPSPERRNNTASFFDRAVGGSGAYSEVDCNGNLLVPQDIVPTNPRYDVPIEPVSGSIIQQEKSNVVFPKFDLFAGADVSQPLRSDEKDGMTVVQSQPLMPVFTPSLEQGAEVVHRWCTHNVFELMPSVTDVWKNYVPVQTQETTASQGQTKGGADMKQAKNQFLTTSQILKSPITQVLKSPIIKKSGQPQRKETISPATPWTGTLPGQTPKSFWMVPFANYSKETLQTTDSKRTTNLTATSPGQRSRAPRALRRRGPRHKKSPKRAQVSPMDD